MEEEADNIDMEIRTSSMSKATAEKTKEFLLEAFKEYKVGPMPVIGHLCTTFASQFTQSRIYETCGDVCFRFGFGGGSL